MTEPIHVLHVDDEPDFVDMAATFVEREDDRFTIETSNDPREGMDKLVTGEFNCIVSDYDMPHMNGIEFLETVREEYPDLPFILFTGKGSEEVASEAISTGATDYLQKGSGTDRYELLANRIQNAVEQYRNKKHRATLERIRTLVNDINQALIRASSRQQIETQVCDILTDADPYRFTVFAEVDPHTKQIEPSTWAGTGEAFLDDFARSVAEGAPGRQAPGGRAFHEREIAVAQDIQTDPAYEEWRDLALKHEFHALAVVPLEYELEFYGILAVFADRSHAFDDSEQEVLEELGDDIAHAIHAQEVQNQLREERVFIEQALDTLDDIFYLVGADGELRRWNKRFSEITGYTDEALTDMQTVDFFPEDEHERISDAIEETLDTGRVITEATLLTADGDRLPYEFTGARLTDTEDNLMGLVGIGRDITERKEREQELEQTRDLLAQTERIANVGGWEIDTDTMDVFWTDNLFNILGVSYEEEPPLDKALDVYHEEDRLLVETAVEQALESGDPFDVEARFRRPDGEVRWLQVSGTPTVENGEVVTLRGAVQDITEQKEREQQRETTIEFLRIFYDVATDKTLDASEKITRLLELGPEKLGLPRGYLTRIKVSDETAETGTQLVIETSGDHELLQPGNSCPLSDSYCRKTIKTDEVVAIQNALAAGWEGDPAYELFDLGSYIGTKVTVDGNLYGTVFFASKTPREDPFTDADRTFVRLMSRLVSYELERDHARQALEQRNERLEEFASIVSHDLRNPLRVAEGRLELARDECESDHLDSVGDALTRSQALIHDLLTLAREGDEVSDIEPVNLGTLTENCWHDVATAEPSIVGNTERTVKADRSRLQQLFENLFRNAIEHGGDDVTVTVGDFTDGFYIEDDGPGIPEDDRDEVFDAGYSTSDEGTGFGLRIIEQVVDAHDWSIRVTDSEDGGARFEIIGVEFVAK